MRIRSVLPFLVGIALVAVLAGSAVRSSDELIKGSEQMRFADRTSLTMVRASQAEQYLTLLSTVVSGMAKTYPLTGAQGSAQDRAILDDILVKTYGRVMSAAVFDPSWNQTVTSGDGSLVPPASDPGYADFRLPKAANPLGVSRAMFVGKTPTFGFAATFGPEGQPHGTLAVFFKVNDLNGIETMTMGRSVVDGNGGLAGLVLYDRALTVLGGPSVADVGTRLPDLRAYRVAVGAKAGHVEFEQAGVRKVLIHVPVGVSGYTMAYVQDATSFFGPLRAKHQRSNMLLFGTIAFFGVILVIVAARRHQVVRRNEDRLSALFRSAADVVAVVRDGRISFVSAGVQRLMGRSPDEVRGMDMAGLLGSTEDAGPFEELVTLAAESPGTEVTAELVFAHTDGRPRWVEVAAVDMTSDAAVGGVVFTLHDVTERKALEAEIRRQSLHDPLTELANRTLFNDRLQQATSRLARSDRAVAVLYMDLDGFKPINDEFGHAAGDQVLQEVAARLRSVVRPSDTVARLGGDEFAVLIGDLTERDVALKLADRCSAAVSSPIQLEEGPVTVGVSIGVAFAEGRGTDAETLVHNADLAMYTAKAQGGSGIEWFGPHLATDHSRS